MGVVSRLAGTAVLVAGAVGGWWWWNGGSLPLPDAMARVSGGARDSMSTAPAEGLATARWWPVNAAMSDDASKRLLMLNRRVGPAVVTLNAGELASFLVKPFQLQLPLSAQDAKVAVVGDMIYIKALVPLSDMGGEAILGPLRIALDRRDTVTIGGTFDLVDRGVAQFRIREVIMGEFSVPRPLVPRLIASTRRGALDARYAEDAYPVQLPSYVGDVRIARGQISVYRLELPNGN